MTQPQHNDVGHAARWLLLVSTVFGLAMMHTLGHAGMQMTSGTPATMARDVSASRVNASAVGVVAALPATPCTSEGCSHHGAMDGWSICLAVLGGLALIVVFAALRRLRRSSTGGLEAAAVARLAPRAPPRRPVELRAISTVVLRI